MVSSKGEPEFPHNNQTRTAKNRFGMFWRSRELLNCHGSLGTELTPSHVESFHVKL